MVRGFDSPYLKPPSFGCPSWLTITTQGQSSFGTCARRIDRQSLKWVTFRFNDLWQSTRPQSFTWGSRTLLPGDEELEPGSRPHPTPRSARRQASTASRCASATGARIRGLPRGRRRAKSSPSLGRRRLPARRPCRRRSRRRWAAAEDLSKSVNTTCPPSTNIDDRPHRPLVIARRGGRSQIASLFSRFRDRLSRLRRGRVGGAGCPSRARSARRGARRPLRHREDRAVPHRPSWLHHRAHVHRRAARRPPRRLYGRVGRPRLRHPQNIAQNFVSSPILLLEARRAQGLRPYRRHARRGRRHRHACHSHHQRSRSPSSCRTASSSPRARHQPSVAHPEPPHRRQRRRGLRDRHPSSEGAAPRARRAGRQAPPRAGAGGAVRRVRRIEPELFPPGLDPATRGKTSASLHGCASRWRAAFRHPGASRSFPQLGLHIRSLAPLRRTPPAKGLRRACRHVVAIAAAPRPTAAHLGHRGSPRRLRGALVFRFVFACSELGLGRPRHSSPASAPRRPARRSAAENPPRRRTRSTSPERTSTPTSRRHRKPGTERRGCAEREKSTRATSGGSPGRRSPRADPPSRP